MSGDVNVEEDEVLDPRIKDELEALNSAADSINKLENEVQRARSNFRIQKAECVEHLNQLVKKIGKRFIIKARPYYEFLKHVQKLQLETQKVTANYQKANSIYKAAQETVTLAEERLVGDDGDKLAFDAAWQEMLNHANRRFMEAENEKRICESEHQRCSKEFESMQQKLAFMHKDLGRAISKSKPFYETKKKYENKLQAERQNAEDLQLALICCKQKYKMALSGLERISEEIHMQRKVDLSERTPGVGAESDAASDLSDLQSINFGGNLNGHVGEKTDGFDNVHGGFGYGKRNEDGNRILEFAESHWFCLLNTYFRKRLEHLITYKSGPSAMQIDFFAVKQQHRRLFKYVKVIPGESYFLSETSSQVSKDDLADFDSDFGFDEEWGTSGASKVKNNNSSNAADSFLNKISNKFNRSNSLGYLNAAEESRFSISSFSSKDDTSKNFETFGAREGSINKFSRDNHLEGAEYLEEVKDKPSKMFSTEEVDSSSTINNTTFTSVAYLAVSTPIDKSKHLIEGNREGRLAVYRNPPLKPFPHSLHKQQQGSFQNIDTEPLQQLPIQQTYQHQLRVADQSNNLTQHQTCPRQITSNQHPSLEKTFQIAPLDKVNHLNVLQPCDLTSEHSSQLTKKISHPTPVHLQQLQQHEHQYNSSKKHDCLPHTQLLNNLYTYKQKLTSIDKQMEHCYLTDINIADSHQVIKPNSEAEHQKREETNKNKKGLSSEEVFV
ncbi:hypothetical protein HELRODRAFT_190408 [Helobdella robusta]|uniref:Uncharacterized protein n=1 Tax=Helobdella robusta TaxID=6412 RepID=T1FRY9_HELRO|nr:hypothetical protein HELRODRAFT_190408 [Helobdella robusta]ESO10208.1 hypothetical protein HELRODRAFT_190408 [Helobdella robusta]